MQCKSDVSSAFLRCGQRASVLQRAVGTSERASEDSKERAQLQATYVDPSVRPPFGQGASGRKDAGARLNSCGRLADVLQLRTHARRQLILEPKPGFNAADQGARHKFKFCQLSSTVSPLGCLSV